METARRAADRGLMALGWAALALTMVSALLFLVRLLALDEVGHLGYIPDDTFYYLTASRAFSEIGQWTFDSGISSTSGFHPLYAYLIAPLFPLVEDTGTLLELLAALSFVVAAATAVGFGVASLRAGRWEVAVAISALAASVIITRHFTIPIEWPFALVFGCLFWLEVARGGGYLGDSRVRKRAALWAALAVLARADFALTIFVLGVFELGSWWRLRRVRWRAVWAASGGVAGYLLVALHSWMITGSAAQTSMTTKLEWALESGVSVTPAAMLLTSVFAPFDLGFGLGLSSAGKLVVLLGIVACFVAVYLWLRRARSRRRDHASYAPMAPTLLKAATAVVVVYLLAYSFNANAMDTWYTVHLLAPLVILGAHLLGRLSESMAPAWLAVVCAVYFAPHITRVQVMHPYKAGQRALHQLAIDSGDLAESTRVGSFNAGILGFYQGGRVINLDGLMNADIAAHRAADSLLCYLRATGITHIQDLDFANVSDSYWRSCGDSRLELRGALREVRDATHGETRAVLYEIDWDHLAGRGECDPPTR